jgi:hypothetical protein
MKNIKRSAFTTEGVLEICGRVRELSMAINSITLQNGKPPGLYTAPTEQM